MHTLIIHQEFTYDMSQQDAQAPFPTNSPTSPGFTVPKLDTKECREWVYRGLGDLSSSGDVEIPLRLRHGTSIKYHIPCVRNPEAHQPKY
jgi:hypothetical protein